MSSKNLNTAAPDSDKKSQRVLLLIVCIMSPSA